MTVNLPEKTYTETQLTRATVTSRVIGWLQGGAVVLGGAILLRFLGWIPVIIGLVVVGWVLMKLLSHSKNQRQKNIKSLTMKWMQYTYSNHIHVQMIMRTNH